MCPKVPISRLKVKVAVELCQVSCQWHLNSDRISVEYYSLGALYWLRVRSGSYNGSVPRR